MSTSRSHQAKHRLYDNLQRPPTDPTVLWVQFEQSRRCHSLNHRRRQHEGASPRNVSRSAFPALPASYLETYLSHPVDGDWRISADKRVVFLASAAIKIETTLMDLSVIHSDAGPYVPCYVAIALDIRSRRVLAFRLFYGVTLHQATLRALDAMLEKVTGAVSIFACAPQRYRYGGTDFEVIAIRDGSVWLRPTGFLESKVTLCCTRTALRRTLHAIPAGLASTLLPRRNAGEADVTARAHPKRSKVDHQAKAIQEFARHCARTNAWHPALPTFRTLAGIIAVNIKRLNQTRPLDVQLTSPSYTKLYRLIRDIRGERRN